MARTTSFSQVLWLLTTAWLAGCGRLGFDDGNGGASNHLPDAAETTDAAIDAPPVGPKIATGALPTMTAECGMAVTTYDLPLHNPGDQDLVISAGDVGTAAVQQGNPGGDTFQLLTELPITIPAGGTATLQVKPPRAVMGTDRAKSTKTATLTLSTNAPGQESFAIALASTVTGANFDIVINGGGGANGTTLNLTSNTTACPVNRTVTITNSGNVEMPLSVQSSSGALGATLSGFTSGALAVGKTQTTTFTAFTPSGACHVDNAQVVFTASGASGVCTTDLTITVNMDINGASGGSCSCP